jgi:hypothetical protein
LEIRKGIPIAKYPFFYEAINIIKNPQTMNWEKFDPPTNLGEFDASMLFQVIVNTFH